MDRKTNGNRLETRLETKGGRIRGLAGGRAYTLSLLPLTGMAHVTHPGKVPNGNKSPGTVISWGMGRSNRILEKVTVDLLVPQRVALAGKLYHNNYNNI